MRRKMPSTRLTLSQWLTLGLAGMSLFFLISLAQRTQQCQMALAERRQAQMELAAVQQYRAELEGSLEQVSSEAYLDQLAREELGWERADEGSAVVKYLEPEEPPLPPAGTAPALLGGPPYWSLWLDTFLGRNLP